MTFRELFEGFPETEVSTVVAVVGAAIAGYALLQIGALLIFWWIDRKHANELFRPPKR